MFKEVENANERYTKFANKIFGLYIKTCDGKLNTKNLQQDVYRIKLFIFEKFPFVNNLRGEARTTVSLNVLNKRDCLKQALQMTLCKCDGIIGA